MIFPPQLLHNRTSAHYLEINHIFMIEMLKKYHSARAQIVAERNACSDQEKKTRYITNKNYVYEKMGPDPIELVNANHQFYKE